MAVINELGGEKIDVIEWKDDPAKFITNALSPAKISGVKIDPLGGGKNTAVVFVSEGQLSLAIGKDGRNVRLASNLTGWKIDIKPDEKAADVKDEKDEKDEKKDAEDLAEEKPEGEKEEKPKKKHKKTKKDSEET